MSMEKLFTSLKALENIRIDDIVVKVNDMDGDVKIVVQNEPSDGRNSLITEVTATLNSIKPYTSKDISVSDSLLADDWMLYQVVGTHLANSLKKRIDKDFPYTDSAIKLVEAIDEFLLHESVFGVKRMQLANIRVLDSLFTHLFPYTNFIAEIDNNEQEPSVSYLFKSTYDIKLAARQGSGTFIDLINPNSTSKRDVLSLTRVGVNETDHSWNIKPECYAECLLGMVDAVAEYKRQMADIEERKFVAKVQSMEYSFNRLQQDIELIKKGLGNHA